MITLRILLSESLLASTVDSTEAENGEPLNEAVLRGFAKSAIACAQYVEAFYGISDTVKQNKEALIKVVGV